MIHGHGQQGGDMGRGLGNGRAMGENWDNCNRTIKKNVFAFKLISPSNILKQKYICKENYTNTSQYIFPILKYNFFSLSFIHNCFMAMEALVLKGLPFLSMSHFTLSLPAVMWVASIKMAPS